MSGCWLARVRGCVGGWASGGARQVGSLRQVGGASCAAAARRVPAAAGMQRRSRPAGRGGAPPADGPRPARLPFCRPRIDLAMSRTGTSPMASTPPTVRRSRMLPTATRCTCGRSAWSVAGRRKSGGGEIGVEGGGGEDSGSAMRSSHLKGSSQALHRARQHLQHLATRTHPSRPAAHQMPACSWNDSTHLAVPVHKHVDHVSRGVHLRQCIKCRVTIWHR